jgi:hypothetical protein
MHTGSTVMLPKVLGGKQTGHRIIMTDNKEKPGASAALGLGPGRNTGLSA